MKKTKVLLYCLKAKPYLYKTHFVKVEDVVKGINNKFIYEIDNHERTYLNGEKRPFLNGTIVAECDFEVEEHKETTIDWLCMSLREKIIFGNMCKKANIDELKCYEYANGKPLYAIHIKNLHIFDEPRELSDYYKFDGIYSDINNWETIDKAPQNMMYAYDLTSELCLSGTFNRYLKEKILISIRPEWLCKILNGEKTIEVRRKVLKKMLENE